MEEILIGKINKYWMIKQIGKELMIKMALVSLHGRWSKLEYFGEISKFLSQKITSYVETILMAGHEKTLNLSFCLRFEVEFRNAKWELTSLSLLRLN